MNEPIQDDLLGYVLGALDADQQQSTEQKIDADPKLEEELLDLKTQLAPLEFLAEPTGMRPGLARRTIEMIATRRQPSADDKVVLRPVAEAAEPLSRSRAWGIKDFLVAAAALVVMASLLFPAIAHAKRQSEIVHCSNNLRNIGMAFAEFSENNNGRFVEIPASGPLAFGGAFGPILKEANVVEDDSWFACKAVNREQPLLIPSTDQIRRSSAGEQSEHYRRLASGDYAYSFGHFEKGNYVSPRSMGRAYYVIAADKPSATTIAGASDNHGGRGQNCLLEDFSVRFVKGNAIAEDPIYVNAQNVVAPGIGSRDSVIGPSHLAPLHGIPTASVSVMD